MARLGQPLLFVVGAPTCDLFILTVVRLERPPRLLAEIGPPYFVERVP